MNMRRLSRGARTLGFFLLLPSLATLSCDDDDDDRSEGQLAGECSDNADNDGNGLFDCDDPGCDGASICGGASNSSSETNGESEDGESEDGESEDGGVECGPQFDPGGRDCAADLSVCSVGCFCEDAAVLGTYCDNGTCRSAGDSCTRACEGFGAWDGPFGCDPAA